MTHSRDLHEHRSNLFLPWYERFCQRRRGERAYLSSWCTQFAPHGGLSIDLAYVAWLVEYSMLEGPSIERYDVHVVAFEVAFVLGFMHGLEVLLQPQYASEALQSDAKPDEVMKLWARGHEVGISYRQDEQFWQQELRRPSVGEAEFS